MQRNAHSAPQRRAVGVYRSEPDIRALQFVPYNEPKRLEQCGFRSFSQNQEDGILQEILRRVGTPNASLVEFGVGNGLHNNSRSGAPP
jgi:hypothetical protein